jgi:hypothetical protein
MIGAVPMRFALWFLPGFLLACSFGSKPVPAMVTPSSTPGSYTITGTLSDCGLAGGQIVIREGSGRVIGAASMQKGGPECVTFAVRDLPKVAVYGLSFPGADAPTFVSFRDLEERGWLLAFDRR